MPEETKPMNTVNVAINERGRIVNEILDLWEKGIADPRLARCKHELEIASSVLTQTFTTEELIDVNERPSEFEWRDRMAERLNAPDTSDGD